MKKPALFLSIAAMVAFSAAMSQAALVSLYTFDDNANIGANAVNSAYNGTPASTAGASLPTSVAGVLGNAMSTTLNNRLNIPANCPPTGTQGRVGTISVWAKGTLAQNNTDFQLISLAGAGGGYFWFDTEMGKFGMFLQAADGKRLYWIGAQNNWPDTTNWHQITISWSVYNGSPNSGREQVYIDGNPIAMNSTGSPAFNGYANNWTPTSSFGNAYSTHQINGDRPDGANNKNWCNGMTGAMDDFALWSTEFTAAQAKALHHLNKDSTLKYNAKDVDVLFRVYDDGGNMQTTDGKTWTKVASGLGDTAGAIVDLGGGLKGVNLGGAGGAGVQMAP